MKIGVPKETAPSERRVALIPPVVASLADRGIDVVVEAGAGEGAGHPDAEYTEAGGESGDPWGGDAVVHVAVPSVEEIGRLTRGQVLIGDLAPLAAGEANQ